MAHERWTDDSMLPPIGDDAMRAALTESRPYSVVILRDGRRADHPDRERIAWEHGRRNLRLRAAGLLAIVVAIRDGSPVHGIGVFDLDPEATRSVMAADPAVQAEVFAFEVHPGHGLPGDRLPVPAEVRTGPASGPEPYERRHRDGSLWARGYRLDGEQHGDWEWFRTDGSLMRSGSFDRGTQVGVWATYDRDGRVLKRTCFPGTAGSATDHTADDQWAGDV